MDIIVKKELFNICREGEGAIPFAEMNGDVIKRN